MKNLLLKIIIVLLLGLFIQGSYVAYKLAKQDIVINNMEK